jgi:hypothetical protein
MIDAGVARTTLQVNAFDVPHEPGGQPLALKVEEVLDATRRIKAAPAWPKPRSLRSAFHIYDDGEARDFTAMCNLPRRGRIAVPRSRWPPSVEVGEYPITVVL